MSFGKLVLGIILVGVGALLLAAPLGLLPDGVWPWLLKFWPVLLLGVGLAFLANGLKNAVLGVFAAALVVGCLGFAAYWISQHTSDAKRSHDAVFDLERPMVSAVTVHGRSIAGGLSIQADARANHEIRASIRGVPGATGLEPVWRASDGVGVLLWPPAKGVEQSASVGGRLGVSVPVHTAVRCVWESWGSWADADVTGLRLERCEFRAVCSNIRVALGGSGRPSKIVVRGTLSNVEIRVPSDCPVRIEAMSRLSMRSLPTDFLEHVSGRAGPGATYWTSDGKGRPLVIRVEGPLMRLHVTREPVQAV
jgi:hypothetical protein